MSDCGSRLKVKVNLLNLVADAMQKSLVGLDLLMQLTVSHNLNFKDGNISL